MSINSVDHMRIAASQELQDAIKIRRINIELLEYLCSSIRWLVRYATKNAIRLPDIDKIEQILDRAVEIDERTPLTSDDGYSLQATTVKLTSDN
jgi:hypothetical protein